MISDPGKNFGILLAAFGSGSPVGHQTLAAFESRVRSLYPDTIVRWAFTSEHMRSRLLKSKVKSDSVHKALMRMQFERIQQVAVQPLHIIPGVEYEELLEEAQRAQEESGLRVSVGSPLLHSEEDVEKSAQALIKHLPRERKAGEVVLWMGHGSWHDAKYGYDALSKAVQKHDACIFVGTLDGHRCLNTLMPDLSAIFEAYECQGENCLEKMQLCRDRVVWLLPLLSVIGRHALHDMAGKHRDSWKSCLLSAGFDCRPVLKGTAEHEAFISIWVDHLVEAVNKLRV